MGFVLGIRKPQLEAIGLALVMLIASISRLWNLQFPSKLVFDETYYVKDALTLSLEGHERSWPEGADQAFQSGEIFGSLNDPAFVVHPPMGKWLIASGMWLVGPDQSFGWRLSTALLGIATVALLMLVALRLFKSVNLAIVAGLLLAIDGLAISMSRTALLDASLTFFLLLGFLFFLLDQDISRVKIVRAIERGKSSLLLFRPWLWLTGVALGAASSIKWSGLYLLAGLGIYIVVSETLLRKNSGEMNWFSNGVVLQGLYSFVCLVPIAALSYLATWIGWITGSGGYVRSWANENPQSGLFGMLPDWMQSLWHYHAMIYQFHVGLTSDHAYQSHPLSWLLGIRPTAFFYESYVFGENGCEIQQGCSSAITALGNPLIWLSSTAALVYLVVRYAKHRERVIGLTLLGTASLYLPWLIFSERTVFQFYVVSFQPWLILGLVLALRVVRQKVRSKSKFLADSLIIGFIVLAIGISIYFYPVNTGIYMPYDQWRMRMWLPSWI